MVDAYTGAGSLGRVRVSRSLIKVQNWTLDQFARAIISPCTACLHADASASPRPLPATISVESNPQQEMMSGVRL